MEKLRIYQSALELVFQIYALIRKHPSLRRDFSLSDQIKRAAVSILANIAEGYSRSANQYRHFLDIASGSSNEVVALLQIINRIYQIDTVSLQDSFKVLGKQINAFSKTITPNQVR